MKLDLRLKVLRLLRDKLRKHQLRVCFETDKVKGDDVTYAVRCANESVELHLTVRVICKLMGVEGGSYEIRRIDARDS